MSQSLKGRILLAAPHLTDPNFQRAVVLLCEHSEEGALGVVLNRPGSIGLGEAFPDLDAVSPPGNTLREGGPVQPSSVFILHDDGEVGGEEVLSGLWFAADLESLQRLSGALQDRPDDFRFRMYAGYAGWGAKQLDQELERGDWIVCPGRADWAFAAGAQETWSRILCELGGRFALIARAPLNPDLN